MTATYAFVQGAVSALSVVAALLFARLWRRSHDRLYLLFALAFLVMAASWGAIAWQLGEHGAYPYATRLVAFLVIIGAIVDKNRRSG